MSIASWWRRTQAARRTDEKDENRELRAIAGKRARRRIISEKSNTIAVAHEQVQRTRGLGGASGP